MKKPYQIEDRRAMQRFEASLRSREDAVQLMLPTLEIAEAMRNGVGELMRQAGLQLVSLLIQQEVEQLAGPRNQNNPQRAGYRWGQEEGWCRIDGQKVPLSRPRIRDPRKREIRLGSYLSFQQQPAHGPQLWQELMRGLSTRSYGPTVRKFAEAYGIEKSAVSEQFIEASRARLKELLERPLGDVALCAILIDGISFDGDVFVIALGICRDGQKKVLGLRQGATENATVVGQLCEDLAQRGVDFAQPRLYVLDGAKALSAAVKRCAGEAAIIQRCQLHKRRNVLHHLPEEHQPFMEQKLTAAWNMHGYAEARRALEKVQAELERLNPSAARSLAEGMEETLTIHRLGVGEMLRKTLFSTNPIESALSVVEEKCHRVKRWQAGDMKLRWVVSGLLAAESQFRRVKGHKDLPQLITAIQAFPRSAAQNNIAIARKVG